MAPPPPELNYDITVEILLRLPPDEPASLFRAALVCKLWLRIICDPRFRIRYRTFHGGPPLLGLLHNLMPREDAENPPSRSVSDSSLLVRFYKFVKGDPRDRFAPRLIPNFTELFPGGELFPLDCRHGRVLVTHHNLDASRDYSVWDPVTGDLHGLPKPPDNDFDHSFMVKYSATVLCTADGCNHFDCHGSPFCVILAATSYFPESVHGWMYSSETDTWSEVSSTDVTHIHYALRPHAPYLSPVRPTIVQGAVYFPVRRGNAIIKYDLGTNLLSCIKPPPTDNYYFALMPIDSKSLGFACVEQCSLYVWSRKIDTEDWQQYMVTELGKDIPVTPNDLPFVVGFAEGPNTIFVSTSFALYTISLSSGQVKKFDEAGYFGGVLPYMSFYMPGVPRGNHWTNIIGGGGAPVSTAAAPAAGGAAAAEEKKEEKKEEAKEVSDNDMGFSLFD